MHLVLRSFQDGEAAVDAMLQRLVEDGASGSVNAAAIIASKVKGRHIMFESQKEKESGGPAPEVAPLRSAAEKAAKLRSRFHLNRAEKLLPAKMQRELKLSDMSSVPSKYELYLPLATLWKEYIAEIISKNPKYVFCSVICIYFFCVHFFGVASASSTEIECYLQPDVVAAKNIKSRLAWLRTQRYRACAVF